MHYETLAKRISVDNPTDTRLIDISVRDADPQMAADISNALADSLCEQVATIMKTDRPTIAERAVAPDKPSAPSMKKNVVIAALLGLFATMAVIVIQYILDDSIKTAEDVEKYLQLNTLASIPLEFSDDSETKTRKKIRKKK
jgi:capsular polysaccharide biosynthesis protein